MVPCRAVVPMRVLAVADKPHQQEKVELENKMSNQYFKIKKGAITKNNLEKKQHKKTKN